jgi:hypothetical protein
MTVYEKPEPRRKGRGSIAMSRQKYLHHCSLISSLKMAWWPASPDSLTPVPVWDNDPRFPGDAKNPPKTWKRVVVVDPTNSHPSPASVKLGNYDHPNPKVVSLDKFYAVRVSAEEADLANADFRIKAATTAVLGRPLQEGDYLLLTAVHIATRKLTKNAFPLLPQACSVLHCLARPST